MKDLKDKDTRERIRCSALREFAEHGFSGARIDRIAARSGANKAMIYYHFEGKEGLYFEILKMTYSGICEKFDDIYLSELSPGEKLERMFASVQNFIQNVDPDLKKMILWEIASGGSELGRKAISSYLVQIFSNVLKIYNDSKAAGVVRADVNPLAAHLLMISSFLVSSMLFSTFKECGVFGNENKDIGIDDFFSSITDVIKNGLVQKHEA